MRKKKITKKILLISLISIVMLAILGTVHVSAISDDKIINILSKNSDLFTQNSIFASVFRYLGWLVTSLLTLLAKTAGEVFDTCFGFVDFTQYAPVENFIDKWKPVFIALVCLSILLIGILMCIGWEKKPQFMINLLIAVAVISSSTFFMNTLNGFISQNVRNQILGTSGSAAVAYDLVKENIHDLVWLDQQVGLENINADDNAKKVYDSLTEEQFNNIDINEVIEPSDLEGDAKKIVKKALVKEADGSYSLENVYNGVAWTDMLNEYYYRYKVDFFVLWLELASMFIVYLFMSYKVIRVLYEIVVHRILAYLYSANLNNNQKILKILDSLKDSYIILVLITVMIKIYLLATQFISSWDISGLTKGLILIFIAFAVIDGPNLVQKLTGTDIGATEGLGKFMSMIYAGRTAAGAVRGATNVAKKGVEKVKGAVNNYKNSAREMLENNMNGTGNNDTPSSDGNNDNNLNQQNNNNNEQRSNNNLNQNNNQDNRQTNQGSMSSGMDSAGTDNSINGSNSADNPLSANSNSESGTSAIPNNNNTMPEGAGNNSALSSEQGKQQGGYKMNDIGQVQSKRDVLNGVNNSNKTLTDDSMKQMEKDVAKTTPSSNSYSNPIQDAKGKPIDTDSPVFVFTEPKSSFPKINTPHKNDDKEE